MWRIAVGMLLLLGCAHVVVDHFDSFHVEGRVVDELGRGIPDARVYFVDTGLDQWRNASQRRILLGTTDLYGFLSVTIDYTWGYRNTSRSRTRDRPSTLSLVIEKNGFLTKELAEEIAQLQRRNDYLLLRFDSTLEEAEVVRE